MNRYQYTFSDTARLIIRDNGAIELHQMLPDGIETRIRYGARPKLEDYPEVEAALKREKSNETIR